MNERPTILIADDDPQIATTLAEHLTEQGYEVTTASDGDETMALLVKSQFALVVLDLKMPKVNGFGVLKFIKQANPSTKVVVLTGYADLRNAMECRRLGADDFIRKPYDLGDIIDTVARLVNR
jgi:two-component system nitrogen regulation response regulator NtrX